VLLTKKLVERSPSYRKNTSVPLSAYSRTPSRVSVSVNAVDLGVAAAAASTIAAATSTIAIDGAVITVPAGRSFTVNSYYTNTAAQLALQSALYNDEDESAESYVPYWSTEPSSAALATSASSLSAAAGLRAPAPTFGPIAAAAADVAVFDLGPAAVPAGAGSTDRKEAKIS
jgi:hypothetical protein